MIALVCISLIAAYSLGLIAGNRMSRWHAPIPTATEIRAAVVPESPPPAAKPDKDEDEEETSKMWRMFAEAGKPPMDPSKE